MRKIISKKVITFCFVIIFFTTFSSAAYDNELKEAFNYASKNGITTMTSIDNANMYGILTRIEMAKMLANYSINVLGLTPDKSIKCSFSDVTEGLDILYDNGVTNACQLGLMGIDDYGNISTKFNPNEIVTRAQFATAFSRALNLAENWKNIKNGNPYYRPHIEYLNKKGIIKSESEYNVNNEEIRGYVMLMMMRTNKQASGNNQNLEFSFTKFDDKFINYIGEIKQNENFMVSPTSFKLALALLTIGANGKDQESLLNTVGYETDEDYSKRISDLQRLSDKKNQELQKIIDKEAEVYKEYLQRYDEKELKEMGIEYKENTNTGKNFYIANSVRHNKDKPGTFLQSYKNKIINLGGKIGEVSGNELKNSINDMVEKDTNGLIKDLVLDSIGQANTILINTLYLKANRKNKFDKDWTKEGEFTDINGNIVEKKFMKNKGRYKYYEDTNSQVLTMNLDGGFFVSFILGDNSNISNKIKNSSYENVEVKLPKFEINTSLNGEELINFLLDNGVAKNIFDENIGGDFSNMISNASIYVSDIIQKTKIDLNEDGIEAAAATAIITESTATFEEPQYKEFIANRPFLFYIYTNENNQSELLFYGQYIK